MPRFSSRDWPAGPREVFILLLVLLVPVVAPAGAQDLQTLERRVAALEAIAQAPTVTGQIAGVNQRLEEVKKQLEEIKASSVPARPSNVAPVEAWWALGRVGWVFVAVWGALGIAREYTRRQEVRVAEKKLPVVLTAEQNEEIQRAIDHRLEQLADLLARVQKVGAGGKKE